MSKLLEGEKLLYQWQLRDCGCITAMKPRGRPWTIRVKGAGYDGQEYHLEGQAETLVEAIKKVLNSPEFEKMVQANEEKLS
jgi:hypothetical protein